MDYICNECVDLQFNSETFALLTHLAKLSAKFKLRTQAALEVTEIAV